MSQQTKTRTRTAKNATLPPPAPSLDADMLVGMKAICSFLRMSEATVIKWTRDFEDFPVKKNGGYVSSRHKLNIWFQAYLERS